MTDNTMKYLAIFLATITIVNSAAIIHKNYEDVPAEKISILGPSGSITQLKNVDSTKTKIVGPSGFIKHEQYSKSTADDNSAKISSEVTYIEGPSGSSVAKNGVVSTHQHTADCVHDKEDHRQEANTAFSQHGSHTFVKNEGAHEVSYYKPDQITSDSGSHVDFESLLNGYFAAIYKTVDNSPVTAKPSVQYIHPSVEDVIVTQGNTVVSSPSKKTNVFGPSGTITHETYYQLQNVVKNNPVTAHPEVVQHAVPVVENVAVSQHNQVVGTPSEKTSIVGPSGQITQEKYYQSTNKDSFKVYNFVKNNPVTGKPEVVQHVVPVVENVAVAQENQVLGSPSEKTSVVGPSGQITQEKYYQATNKDSFKVYNFVKNNPVTGKPEVVQHVVPVVENVAVAQENQVLGTPSEKTSVVGPSGQITQEKYYQATNKDSFKVYNFVKNNPVTGKPEVVQHVVPVVENVAVSQHNQVVGTPSEKTSIVGPSGQITQEKYHQSTNKDSFKVYNFVKNNPVTGKPEVVQHVVPVVENVAVAQENQVLGTPSEKTSVVGPSGQITQEKYYQSTNKDSFKVYNFVKNNPVTGKPEVVQHVVPVVENVALAQENQVLGTPSEKTSVVGPSGQITQEKYYQATNKDSFKVYNFVKNNPVTGKPEVVQHVVPVVENVAVSQHNQVVGTPSEKTSIVGPSGQITQEKYHQSTNKDSFKVYNFVKNNPVTGKPEVVQHVVPVVENVAVAQENQVLGTPSEKTSVVGPSGQITQEKYYQSTNKDSFKVYNFVKNNPVTGKPEVVQHVVPVVENVALAQENQVLGTPSEKTSVVGPSGQITQEKYYQATNKDSFKVYNFVKNNPVTGKPEVVQHVVPVVENVAVSQHNQVVGTPSEKTSIVGPSGQITQEKYHQSTNKDSFKVYNFVKNNPVTGKPEVVQHVVPVVENVAVAQENQVLGTPSEKTSVVGPSGQITQEKYYQSTNKDSFKVYNFVKNNPVTGKPEVVQHVVPVVENVALAQENQVLGTPSEKTSVVGPSGQITQEKYSQSIPNDSFKVYKFVKNNPVTGKPEVVQHVAPVVGNAAIVQDNQVSEKTSVVGPSGKITQEKYYQSIPNNSFKVYNFVKNNPVTGKPEVVHHSVPVFANAGVAKEIYAEGTPSEKTIVAGPSGTITQEKYYQYIDGNSAQTHNVVKNIPLTENSFFVQYLHPSVEKIAVAEGTHIVNSPSETTSVVGPSGSIVQQKFSPANSFVDVKNVSPVNTQFTPPALIQYELVPSKDFVYGTNVNNVPVEKTSIVGPSGSVVQVRNYQPFTDGSVKTLSSSVSVQPEQYLVYNTVQESYGLSSPSEENDCDDTNESETHHHHSQNSVSIDYKNSAPVYYYGYPLVNTVVNHDVNSNYVVQYTIPNGNNALVYDNVVAPAVETSNSGQSGSLTKEIKVDSVYPGTIEYLPYGSVKKVVKSSKGKSDIDYPAIQKYPDVAAHDC